MPNKDQLFAMLQHLVPQHTFSRAFHLFAECRLPWFKDPFINWFIHQYGINMQEAEFEHSHLYKHFNDFFTRALKPGARDLCDQPGAIVSPADGEVSQAGDIRHGRMLQAKGHSFSMTELLGGDYDLARNFMGGKFCTIYLSPRDYHRVHMPCGGTLREMIYVPGKLYSVNKATTENVSNLFSKNERVVCIFDTENGPVAVILVGAMIVASIMTTWAGLVTPPRRQVKSTRYADLARQPIELAIGEEMGRFLLGSTVIMVFPKDSMEWLDSIRSGTRLKVGQHIGQFSVPGDTVPEDTTSS